MKRNKLKKNCTAVSAPLEFTIAFGILLMGLTLLIVMANTMFAPYDMPDPDLKAKAIEISDVIIGNPGFPNDWEDTPWIDNPNYMERFGLAYVVDGTSGEVLYGVLDQDKLDELDKMLNPDNSEYYGDAESAYATIKNVLGLDLQDIVYDFAFSIQIGSGDAVVYGESYQYANIIKSFERKILIEPSGEGSITVIVFR